MMLITADDNPIPFSYDGDVKNTGIHDVNRRVICDLGWYDGEEEPADGRARVWYRSSTGRDSP